MSSIRTKLVSYGLCSALVTRSCDVVSYPYVLGECCCVIIYEHDHAYRCTHRAISARGLRSGCVTRDVISIPWAYIEHWTRGLTRIPAIFEAPSLFHVCNHADGVVERCSSLLVTCDRCGNICHAADASAVIIVASTRCSISFVS